MAETMETVKNIRDNSATSNSVDFGDTSKPLGRMVRDCTDGSGPNSCDAGPFYASSDNYVTCNSANNCQIAYTNNGYEAKSGYSQTNFKRYFYIEDVDSDQKKVHVIVSWNIGTIPFQTEIIGLLTKELR